MFYFEDLKEKKYLFDDGCSIKKIPFFKSDGEVVEVGIVTIRGEYDFIDIEVSEKTFENIEEYLER